MITLRARCSALSGGLRLPRLCLHGAAQVMAVPGDNPVERPRDPGERWNEHCRADQACCAATIDECLRDRAVPPVRPPTIVDPVGGGLEIPGSQAVALEVWRALPRHRDRRAVVGVDERRGASCAEPARSIEEQHRLGRQRRLGCVLVRTRHDDRRYCRSSRRRGHGALAPRSRSTTAIVGRGGARQGGCVVPRLAIK
jgi:hypothetical protein